MAFSNYDNPTGFIYRGQITKVWGEWRGTKGTEEKPERNSEPLLDQGLRAERLEVSGIQKKASHSSHCSVSCW